MPTNNQAVKFVSCTSTAYVNLGAYNNNTLYFISDTQQIFVGDQEYTKSIEVLTAQPNAGTIGKNGKLYVYNGNLYMCQVEGFTYNWIRIANVNDTEGTVTKVSAGTGLDGGDITATGTISHATPAGAQVRTDSVSDANPSFGGTFEIEGFTTDQFGHVTGVNLHTVTLPSETVLAVSGSTEAAETLSNSGQFEVIIGVEKGTGSHDLSYKKKTFQLPAAIDAPTYSITEGDAEGSVKLVCSTGATYEAVVKDWDKLAKLTDVTSVFRYKGKVNTYTDLTALVSTAVVGDVYFVTDTNAEYVFLGSDRPDKWEEMGPAIDLSPYALSANVIPRVTGQTGKVAIFASDGTLASSQHTIESDVPTDAKFTDTVYTHPSHTAHGAGFYKVTVDGEGHVTNATQVDKSDITALGIPAENTDHQVKVSPNTSAPVYLAGSLSTSEVTGELAMNPSAYVNADGSVSATAFHGEADSAAKATADGNGDNIADTYETQTHASTTYATKAEAQDAVLVWQVVS